MADGRARCVALIGGSFNPPHVGHLLLAQYVYATQDVEAVWLMPSASHPLGKQLTSFEDRFHLCERLAADAGPWLTVTDVEQRLGGEGRTVDTLEHLVKVHPERSFRVVVGSDIVAELPLWKDVPRIEQLAPFLFVNRAGHPSPLAIGPPLVEISSTGIRARLKSGQDVSDLVPRGVLASIRARGLYR